MTNVLGNDRHSVLTITVKDAALAAKLDDEKAGETEVTVVDFDGGVLRYKYVEPPPWAWAKDDAKGEESMGRMAAWVQVTGDTFEGPLSSEGQPIDYSVKGRRRTVSETD